MGGGLVPWDGRNRAAGSEQCVQRWLTGEERAPAINRRKQEVRELW